MTKLERVMAIINARGTFDTEVKEISKNGKKVEALVIKGEMFSPVIYEENLPEDEAFAADTAEFIFETAEFEFDREILVNWEKAKDKVRLGARPVTDDNIVTLPFLDIELFTYLELDGNHSVKVQHEMLEVYGIGGGQLFKAASKNGTYVVNNIVDVMRYRCGAEFTEDADQVPLLIVSNKDFFYGAGAIANVGLMMALEAELGAIWVLPSSRHELIIAPGGIEKDMLIELVSEVNQSDVSEEEFLSNSIYLFKDGKYEIFKE